MRFSTVLILTGLLLLSTCVFSQDTDFKNLFSGSKFPLTLKLKDLDAAWYRFENSVALRDMGRIIGLMSGSSTGWFSNINFSQGEIFSVGGQKYLVCYTPLSKPVSFSSIYNSSQVPKLEVLTEDTPLALSLINTSSIQKITGIRQFDLQSEIKLSRIFAGVDGENTPEQYEESFNNLKQLAAAEIQYKTDHDNKYSNLSSISAAKQELLPYVKNGDLFISPRTKTYYKPNTKVSKIDDSDIDIPSEVVLFYEDTADNEGLRAVAFCDGHVTKLNQTDLDRYMKLNRETVIRINLPKKKTTHKKK